MTLKSDNLTDLWAQRLVKFFGWNTREQQKKIIMKKNMLFTGEMNTDVKIANTGSSMTSSRLDAQLSTVQEEEEKKNPEED